MRVDFDALKNDEGIKALKSNQPPAGLPFNIKKIGHIVLNVRDMARSVEFYTKVMGFKISDVYPDTMMPGGMVFMRFSADHHGVALVGGMEPESPNIELNHIAFEVGTLDEVLRAAEHLRQNDVKIDFEGRRRAGCQVAVEFRDPDNHRLEIYWGLDQVGSNGIVRPPEEWREEFSFDGAVKNAPPGQDTTLQDPSLKG